MIISTHQKTAYKTFLIFITLTTFLTLFSTFLIPADVKNTWFLGFSKSRWGMLLLAVSISLLLTIFCIKTFRDKEQLDRHLKRIYGIIHSKRTLAAYYFFIIISFIFICWYVTNWQVYLNDMYLNAYFLRTAPFVFLIAIGLFSSIILIPFFHSSLLIDYLIFFIFLLVVIAIDYFTNNLEVSYMPWDIKYYYLLAERGLEGEKIAPYIYRYATPFLAHTISIFYHLPTYQAYTVIAYLGAISQLFFLYLLLRTLGFSYKSSFFSCLFIAFCQYNVKYLLFDVSRPDHLAYFWVIITSWAYFSGHLFWCGFLSILGLQFREHIAITPFIMMVEQLKIWWKTRQPISSLLRGVFLLGCILIGVAIPRIFIHTTDSTQFVDLQHPATLYNLIALPLDIKRDLNFFYVIVAYLLPILLLATPKRIKIAWQRLKLWHHFLILYSIITCLLTLYGGHDFMRYITFLFLPQAILLSSLFEQRIPWQEFCITLLAMLIFNRIFWLIPIENFDQYVDFYGGYDNRVNLSSFIKWLEIFVSIMSIGVLRYVQYRYNHKSNI